MFVSPPGGDDDGGSDRRTFLKGLGAVGSVGALTSLTGCTGNSAGSPDEEREVREIELLSYTQSQQQIYSALNAISENMDETLGFNMTFTPVNRQRQLTKVYDERDYDVSSLGYTGRPHRLDPHMLMYKNYHSSQAAAGSYNWTAFRDERADELLDEQAQTLDRRGTGVPGVPDGPAGRRDANRPR